MQENGYGLTPFEQDSLFDRIDKNKDGRISFNEFIHELINRL
jgi:Ca2+-binding EF-hand superfamily protein